MGVVISAVGTSLPDNLRSHGARKLADTAIRRCLSKSGVAPRDVDLLVNAGVYRERGLAEPALAALIQEDVHANDRPPTPGEHGTFSFDVANGACGVLTGVDLARGLLSSHSIGAAVVVASDSGTGPVQARQMPFAESGGALLLQNDELSEGFVDVEFATFPEYADLLEAYWAWVPRRKPPIGRRPPGRNRLLVVERSGFRDRAAECATTVARKFLAKHELPASAIDLLVATPQRRFANAVADGLGIPHTRVAHMDERFSRSHTAQPVAAIESAMRNGEWQRAHTVLFVAAGAGITVATALYRD